MNMQSEEKNIIQVKNRTLSNWLQPVPEGMWLEKTLKASEMKPLTIVSPLASTFSHVNKSSSSRDNDSAAY